MKGTWVEPKGGLGDSLCLPGPPYKELGHSYARVLARDWSWRSDTRVSVPCFLHGEVSNVVQKKKQPVRDYILGKKFQRQVQNKESLEMVFIGIVKDATYFQYCPCHREQLGLL